jgi:SNF2 family DNA or RNA helicase
VRLVNDTWIITCEAHVKARLKRVFPRAPQHAADDIRISASTENTRELQWFLQRYPMEVVQAEVLASRAAAHRDMELRLADLLTRRNPPPEIKLAKPARDYQQLVPAMLAIKGGLLLADEVGLGKTVSAILAMMDPENLPAVVVCPTHLPFHWVEKIHEFAPQLKVHRVKHGMPYPLIKETGKRQNDLWPERLPDVIVINYHKLRGWAETLGGLARLVVFDEVQQLRSPGTSIYMACSHVAAHARQRLGLSATPIYNYGSEFHHVIDPLCPDALGQYDEFIREWCAPAPGEKSRVKNPGEFGAYLRREGIMLLRTRKDVGRELPATLKIIHTVESDSAVLKEVKGDAVKLAQIILGHNERYKGEKMQAAGEFDMIMRQATGVAKAPYVAEFVKLLIENGEKVLLFGWHREVYGIWMEALKHYKPVMYTGSESPNQKQEALKSFVEGDSQVMIMSLRSGAGVDGIQHVCRIAVFGEIDWSPGVHEQCIGRPARDGQQDETTAYFLLTDDGSDPVMAEVLGLKREQIDGVRNPEAALIERIDSGENRIRSLARAFLQASHTKIEERTVVVPMEQPEEVTP